MAEPQSYTTHRRYVPAFHFLASSIIGINLIWTAIALIRHPSAEAAVALLLAITIAVLFYYSRQFALTVQDRVIRLEERLRIERLAPDLAPRIGELTLDQLIALRFASDEELPALAKRVLEERIGSQNAIKKMIRSWRADDLRA